MKVIQRDVPDRRQRSSGEVIFPDSTSTSKWNRFIENSSKAKHQKQAACTNRENCGT